VGRHESIEGKRPCLRLEILEVLKGVDHSILQIQILANLGINWVVAGERFQAFSLEDSITPPQGFLYVIGLLAVPLVDLVDRLSGEVYVEGIVSSVLLTERQVGLGPLSAVGKTVRCHRPDLLETHGIGAGKPGKGLAVVRDRDGQPVGAAVDETVTEVAGIVASFVAGLVGALLAAAVAK
jgi:hypothetical protein